MKGMLSRTGAIFFKEMQDLKSNLGVLIMYIIPLVIVLLYRGFLEDMPAGFTLGFGLLFLFTLVGVYGPAINVAEEKEKNTLEVLILSPARPLEIIMGKGLMVLITTAFGGVLVYFLSGIGGLDLGLIIPAAFLLLGTCIFLGMVVGILAPNQTVAGTIVTPVYMVMLLFPLLSLGQDNIIATISRALPTRYFFQMVLSLTEFPEAPEINFFTHFLFLLGSFLITLLVLIFVFRSRGLRSR